MDMEIVTNQGSQESNWRYEVLPSIRILIGSFRCAAAIRVIKVFPALTIALTLAGLIRRSHSCAIISSAAVTIWSDLKVLLVASF